jgi:hypothetical protein
MEKRSGFSNFGAAKWRRCAFRRYWQDGWSVDCIGLAVARRFTFEQRETRKRTMVIPQRALRTETSHCIASGSGGRGDATLRVTPIRTLQPPLKRFGPGTRPFGSWVFGSIRAGFAGLNPGKSLALIGSDSAKLPGAEDGWPGPASLQRSMESVMYRQNWRKRTLCHIIGAPSP